MATQLYAVSPTRVVYCYAFFIFIVITFVGCSSGSGESDLQSPDSQTLKTGVLVDSPVENVEFETPTQSGSTNSDGEFSYRDGESIQFSIGNLAFPKVSARTIITPLTLAGVFSVTDQQATNIARLLLSLDENANPDDGITIPAGAAAVASPINFDVDSASFENDPAVLDLVADSGSVNTVLISEADAQAHISATLDSLYNYPEIDFTDLSSTQYSLSSEGNAQFEIIGLTPGVPYTISVSTISALVNASVGVHAGPDLEFNSQLCWASTVNGAETSGGGSCSTVPQSTSLYLDIRGIAETAFLLDVEVAPVTTLASSNLPATNQTTSAGGTSLFEITGLSPGTSYSVSVIANHNSGLKVFADSSLNQSFTLCASNASSDSPLCNAAPTNTSIFLEVSDKSGMGLSFTLDVILTPVTVLNLASLPVAGQTVPAGRETRFEITGLTPGTIYSFFVSGSTGLLFDVYDDLSGFLSPLCSSPTPPPFNIGSCNVTPTGTSLQLWVRSLSSNDSNITINGIEAVVTRLDIANLPITQDLSPIKRVLFEVTGLTAGTLYNISISRISVTELFVFAGSDLTNYRKLCGAGIGVTSDLATGSCSAAPQSSSLYVQVSDFSEESNSITLDMSVAPVTIIDIASLPAVGLTQSSGSDSLYEITGLSPEISYNVSISGTEGVMQVYSDPGLTTKLCSSNSCSVTPSGTSLYLRVTYYTGTDVTFTLDAF